MPEPWTLPTTAEGWAHTAYSLASFALTRIRCVGDRMEPRYRPGTAGKARAIVRADAQRVLAESSRPATELPQMAADAHLRAPCLDHDAMPCPDTGCTGAIGDGSHDGAPPTCDTCSVTWGRCVRCDTVHDHERDCPGCAAPCVDCGHPGGDGHSHCPAWCDDPACVTCFEIRRAS